MLSLASILEGWELDILSKKLIDISLHKIKQA